MTRDCRSIGTSSGEVSGLRNNAKFQISAANSIPNQPILFSEFISLIWYLVTNSSWRLAVPKRRRAVAAALLACFSPQECANYFANAGYASA
jgi:hypothetical protein